MTKRPKPEEQSVRSGIVGGDEERVPETLGEVVVDGRARAIEVNPQAGRFEIHVGEHLAFTTFHVKGSVLSLIHTEVPAPLRGRGIADALAHKALEYARQHGMTVKPFCPFVAGYIRRHPEFQPVVDPEFATSPPPADGL